MAVEHGKGPVIFISYAKEDAGAAQRLYGDLQRLGAVPWMDTQDLRAGDDWKRAIRHAIEECDFFLALISANSVSKKGYVQKELREAIEVLDRVPEGNRFLLPVRLDDCHVSVDRLRDLQWVNLFQARWAAGIREIALAVELRSDPFPVAISAELDGTERKSGNGGIARTGRVRFAMAAEDVERFRKLQDAIGASNLIGTVRLALRLAEWFAEQNAKGNDVIVDDGVQQTKVLFVL